MEVNEGRRLRELEEENRKLKHIVAEQGARYPSSEGCDQPKVVKPAARRCVATYLTEASVAPNKTKKGRAENRRVVIVVLE